MRKKGGEASGFKKLWAPWRMKYIEGIDTEDAGRCIFCEKPEENNDKKNYIIYRGKKLDFRKEIQIMNYKKYLTEVK